MPINDRDYSPSLLDLTFGEGANGRLKELEPEHARSGARNHVESRSASPRIRRGAYTRFSGERGQSREFSGSRMEEMPMPQQSPQSPQLMRSVW